MKKFICIFAVLTMLFSAISLCVSAEGYDISEPTDEEIAAKQAEIDQIRDVIPGEVVVSFNDEVPFESRRGLLEAVAAFLYPSASGEELEKTVDCREGYSSALLKVKPDDGARAAAILEKSDLVSGVEFNFTVYIDDPAGIKGDVDGDFEWAYELIRKNAAEEVPEDRLVPQTIDLYLFEEPDIDDSGDGVVIEGYKAKEVLILSDSRGDVGCVYCNFRILDDDSVQNALDYFNGRDNTLAVCQSKYNLPASVWDGKFVYDEDFYARKKADFDRMTGKPDANEITVITYKRFEGVTANSGPVEIEGYWVNNVMRVSDKHILFGFVINVFRLFDPETGSTEEKTATAKEHFLSLDNVISVVTDIVDLPVHYDWTINGYLPGDVDGDDRIGANDYAMVKRSVLGTYTLEGEAALRADVNGDGAVDALDYAVLKRHVLGTYDIALLRD